MPNALCKTETESIYFGPNLENKESCPISGKGATIREDTFIRRNTVVSKY